MELNGALWQAGNVDKGAAITDSFTAFCSPANESNDHKAWERHQLAVSMAFVWQCVFVWVAAAWMVGIY